MNQSNIDAQRIDDLYFLMATAILAGQRGVTSNVMPIFDAWAEFYPKDALANVGRGLIMLGSGNAEAGYALIAEAAEKSTTRAEQAQAVLASLAHDLPDLNR
ncbi:hypothetical protein [Paracoccus sp. (in: a-proteobacteria)]|uniref:hypothetical protein n=1 Tax=Paracoccus sp. TaxID=267 RepID=UPI003A855218